MPDEKLTSGEAYTFTLLEEWKYLIEYGKAFRSNYLSGRCDPETINAYVGNLTNMYEILAPKVHSHKGEGDWANLINDFDGWKEWVSNPIWFQYPSSMNRIFEFRNMIGEVIEKLDVTYFPKAPGRNQ